MTLQSSGGSSSAWGPGRRGPSGSPQAPRTHRPRCFRCPPGCWSSSGPWWMTRRTRRQGCSPCSPCSHPSPHPSGSGGPESKQGSPEEAGLAAVLPPGGVGGLSLRGSVHPPTPGSKSGLPPVMPCRHPGAGRGWRGWQPARPAPGSHLGRGRAIEVLPQHPPHVLPGVGGHLVLEQEGELAALPDAVEVAVHLVVLAACGQSPARP